MNDQEAALRIEVRDELQRDLLSSDDPSIDVDTVMTNIECLSSSPSKGIGRAETVRIQMGSDGSIRLATSRKLGNIRLKMGEALTRGVAELGLAAGQLAKLADHPILVILYLLKFLNYVHGVTGITIERRDAELLLRLYAFEREERRVDIDSFDIQVGRLFAAVDYQQSMGRLERLGCISRTGGAYVINEEILVSESR